MVRNAKGYEERNGTSRCLRHIIIRIRIRIRIDKERATTRNFNTDRQGPKSTPTPSV